MSGENRSVLLRYLRYARPYRGLLFVVVLAGVAKFTVPLIGPYVTRLIVDDVARNQQQLPNAERIRLLWTYGAILVGALGATSIVAYLRGYLTARVSAGVTFDLRRDLWRHLQRLSLGFHQSRPTGSLLSRLMSDISVSQQMISQGIVNVFIDLGSGLPAMIILLHIDWRLTLLVLAVLPVYGVLYRQVNPRIRQASRDVQEQTSVMSGSAVERLAGIAVVQSFAQEPAEQQHFAAQADELRGRSVRRGKLSHFLRASSEFLVGLAGVSVWVAGVYMIVAGGEMTIGKILQFTGTAALLYMPIRRFSEINITYQTSMAAIERVFAIFDVVPEVQQRRGLPDRVPAMGGIRFENVDFQYGDGPGVLKGVNFEVSPGERVAVVGESGAGKSTLATLIPRLYDVVGGSIKIDGLDIREYPLRRLRRSIGIVLQDTILFSGTIRENLRYGNKDATQREIVEAANAANAHQFICATPDGYETVIGERGLTLSGGQRQRLSLARTILQNPRILLLDEATSSLDSESENLITEALQRVMVGRTCLIIAHRLSTVINADRILVFRDGCLVEEGPHEQLLEAGGYYRHLFDQQFRSLKDLVSRASGDAEPQEPSG